MALERKDLRAILEDETVDVSGKMKKILDMLHTETDALQNQLDDAKAATAKAEKERDTAANGKTVAEKALTDYKAQQTQKDTHAAKEAKFRDLLKTAGVLDKYADRVVRLSGEDIDKLELDDNGNVKDAKKHADSLKADWSDFVGTTTTTGAKVDTPPTNTGSKMTKEQIFAIKDAGERQAAIAANADLFTGGGKDYHMALERKDLRAILEDETVDVSGKMKKILDMLHTETDALQNQLDDAKAATAKAEKERDTAANGKTVAEKALTDYKAQQTQKDTHAAKEAKFRDLLKTAGVLDKYADRVVRLSGEDIDKLELDDNGNVKDAKKHADSLKADWSDFVGTTTTTGAKVDTPPTNTGSKMTKEQIFAIKDAGERQAAIAANADLFTGGGKD